MPRLSIDRPKNHGVPPIAVTIGEPAGVGPDLVLTAWSQRKQRKLPPFLVLGDPVLLARRAQMLNLSVSTAALRRGEFPTPFSNAMPVLALDGNMAGTPGKPHSDDAALVIESIRLAVEMALKGEAGAIVTAPIAKSVLYDAGFQFPGHTEFLGDLAGKALRRQLHPVMMIAGPALRTIPVTIHVPLSQVPDMLDAALIFETGRIADSDLRRRFGLANPRLAVAGLNPHAGESGSMGSEELEAIVPAIQRLRAAGIDAQGPFPADTLFHEEARRRFDVALCMYHDQALIPAKTLSFHDSVNVTLGLPFIRTSPDHGTAFEIAGTGKADISSFCAALHLAAEMATTASAS